MIEPYYDCDGITIYNADCREVLPTITDGSVNLICTDPPYFKVKNEWWDRQWDKPEEFLFWIGEQCDVWRRVLAFNGSLYVFASPQMAWGVEGEVRQRFKVLNRITWRKQTGWHARQCKEALRGYFPNTESIIFAEQFGADGAAMGVSTYNQKCDELRGFVFEPIRAYLVAEFERAGMLDAAGKIAANVACGFSATSGGMASRHYFGSNQWQMPTESHYHALRELLNKGGGDYLSRPYEDLRAEYEDLRRPFVATKHRPYTDVWEYDTVQARAGKHPCQKPDAMMRHIVLTSSREGDTVLDCFGGSMRLAEVCRESGRNFIGIEISEVYCEAAVNRLAQGVLF
jgi:adenine-specific DNA-methyltransferase